MADYLNAYQWLSPAKVEAVREAKSKAKITNSVNDLLQLALLAEHGGIMADI